MNKKVKKYLLDVLKIIIGTIISAIGVDLFFLPNKLSTGGFTGIATITYYLFNWKMGYVILLINIPLFILAFIRIGKEFISKALIGTVSISVFLNIFEKLPTLTNDRFLACIYGGIIIGIGSSMVLKASGSTGGSDLISYIIKSYKPSLVTSNIIVIFDSIIIALNVIIFKNLEIGLYSAIAIFLMGKVIDIFFEGIDFSKIIFIISNNHDEISDKIKEDVPRGITGIYSRGMFKQEEKIMLMCIASRNEVIKVRNIATQIDPTAFIIITNAREVYGKGFKKINN